MTPGMHGFEYICLHLDGKFCRVNGLGFYVEYIFVECTSEPPFQRTRTSFSTFSLSVLLPELDIRLTDAPPSRDIPFIVQDEFYSVDNKYLFRMLFSQDAIVTTHIVFRAWR